MLVIARKSGRLLASPTSGTTVEPGDQLVLVGPDSKLDPLECKEQS